MFIQQFYFIFGYMIFVSVNKYVTTIKQTGWPPLDGLKIIFRIFFESLKNNIYSVALAHHDDSR